MSPRVDEVSILFFINVSCPFFTGVVVGVVEYEILFVIFGRERCTSVRFLNFIAVIFGYAF